MAALPVTTRVGYLRAIATAGYAKSLAAAIPSHPIRLPSTVPINAPLMTHEIIPSLNAHEITEREVFL